MQTQVAVENAPGKASRDRGKRPEGTWREQKTHKHTVPRAGEAQLFSAPFYPSPLPF